MSWYIGTNRHDFTFRTDLFGGFPEIKRPIEGFNAEVGKRYELTAEIHPERAQYSVNGTVYATATYEKGKVPLDGTFGFAIYNGEEHKVIDSVEIKEIKS